jgi:hypothetical protein
MPKVTCPNPKCAQTFDWSPNVDRCPWCTAEIKKPALPRAHYVQYHRTEEHGPPVIDPDGFKIYTRKPIDGLHGCTVWLISGEGTPKRYFLEYYFVVDEVCEHAANESGFTYTVGGKRGQKVSPRLSLDDFAWFQELRTRLADFSAGLSELGPKSIAELQRLAASETAA